MPPTDPPPPRKPRGDEDGIVTLSEMLLYLKARIEYRQAHLVPAATPREHRP